MTQALNTGQGQCHGTARLLITLTAAAAEMHAGHDILHKVLNAVHHVNRQGSADDFVAAALPGMHMVGPRRLALFNLNDRASAEVKGEGRINEIADLIGSEATLSRLVTCEGFTRLQRMGAIHLPEIEEPLLEAGDIGVAFVRDRSTAKLGPAKLRRMEKRAAQQGRVFTPPSDPQRADPGLCAFNYGQSVVRVRNIEGAICDGPMMVSTYGFSRPDCPAFLPVLPYQAPAFELEDAA